MPWRLACLPRQEASTTSCLDFDSLQGMEPSVLPQGWLGDERLPDDPQCSCGLSSPWWEGHLPGCDRTLHVARARLTQVARIRLRAKSCSRADDTRRCGERGAGGGGCGRHASIRAGRLPGRCQAEPAPTCVAHPCSIGQPSTGPHGWTAGEGRYGRQLLLTPSPGRGEDRRQLGEQALSVNPDRSLGPGPGRCPGRSERLIYVLQ